MPNRAIYIIIDEEILKPLRLIPKNYDTEGIHTAMDEGTKDHGWFHRVMDKWHEPRYIASLGFNTKKGGVPKWAYKEANL